MAEGGRSTKKKSSKQLKKIKTIITSNVLTNFELVIKFWLELIPTITVPTSFPFERRSKDVFTFIGSE